VRNGEREDELRPHIERLFRADERATLGDILRVVREERVDPSVLDTELDGMPVGYAAIGIRLLGRHTLPSLPLLAIPTLKDFPYPRIPEGRAEHVPRC
jgi:hypothetical protein